MPGRALKSVPALALTNVTDDDFDENTDENTDDAFDLRGYDRRGLPCGDWCEPLHLLHAKVRDKPYVGWFDPNDFMQMDVDVREGHRISHYKHRLTRHYLHLDERGRPWGTTPRAADGRVVSVYGPIKTLAAFDAVGIWELPWMKESLHSEQKGYSWHDRTKHPVAKAALKRMTPQRREWAVR